MLTLGTGAGTALFRDGELMPHLELAHHPVSKDKTYDEYIGNAARSKVGNKKWNSRVERVIEILSSLVNYDHLWIGGGNAVKPEIQFAGECVDRIERRGHRGRRAALHPRSMRETRQLPAGQPGHGSVRVTSLNDTGLRTSRGDADLAYEALAKIELVILRLRRYAAAHRQVAQLAGERRGARADRCGRALHGSEQRRRARVCER